MGLKAKPQLTVRQTKLYTKGRNKKIKGNR